MGKEFGPNYANLFLAEWEEKALEKCVLKPILNTHHPSITVKAFFRHSGLQRKQI